MGKFSLKRIGIYLCLFILLFLALSIVVVPKRDISQVKIALSAEQTDVLQLFYCEASQDFTEESSWREPIALTEKIETIEIPFVSTSDKLRIDLGEIAGNTYQIESIEIIRHSEHNKMLAGDIYSLLEAGDISLNQINASHDGEYLVMSALGNDPYFSFEIKGMEKITDTKYVAASFFISLLILIVIYKFVYLRDVFSLAKSVITDRRLLLSLGLNDFKVKYAGSYFGILWAFVQPICTILVFCFVFYYLKSAPVDDVPFSLWLTAGLVPWFFFSEAWNSATNAFLEYSYLVKKVVFKIDILPLVKIFSALLVHLFFVLFMVVLYAVNGFYPEIRMVGLFYYMFCMIVFVMGLSFATASVVVFFKDLTQIMNIGLQILMWMTPIMWSIEILPDNVIKLFKLNPMLYIVQGYRNCMIGNAPIFPDLNQTVYFWLVAIVLFFVGISMFRRLKVHFADVL